MSQNQFSKTFLFLSGTLCQGHFFIGGSFQVFNTNLNRLTNTMLWVQPRQARKEDNFLVALADKGTRILDNFTFLDPDAECPQSVLLVSKVIKYFKLIIDLN